nr:MAG TPA: hypothetical protein [Bacteriophage sp.]
MIFNSFRTLSNFCITESLEFYNYSTVSCNTLEAY